MTARVQLSLQEAAAHALRYLDWRKRILDKRRDAMARRAMRRTWWQRLCRRPARTLEQAHEHLRAGSPFSDYNLMHLNAALYAQAAWGVLKAARNTRDHEATVSVDSVTLAEWMGASSADQPVEKQHEL